MSHSYRDVIFWPTWNSVWVASCLLPLVIVIIGYGTGRWGRWIAAVIAFGVSWYLLVQAVIYKWSLRSAAAITEEDISHATSDGANLVFSLILYGPVASGIYVGLILTGCKLLFRHCPAKWNCYQQFRTASSG
ncbi:hypothetical protein [Lacunimicrobium album]